MRKAIQLGVPVSDLGISSVLEMADSIDIIFDATSAVAHTEHWGLLEGLDKRVIDLTPSRIGDLCVPTINGELLAGYRKTNVNMVTCGGQAAIPVAAAIAEAHGDVDYIEVASSIASRSAGPATRGNIDEYIGTTEDALKKFCRASRAKAILILNPAQPPIDMQTTIYMRINNPDILSIKSAVDEQVRLVKEYTPGYQLVVPPTIVDSMVVTTVKVIGNGDYLPRYAGNLDIINCAAVEIAKRSHNRHTERKGPQT
jgi:acetaldehyde dehydrogenase